MKIPATVLCDAPGCNYKADVDDLREHMDDNCPTCGEPLMDENSKRAFVTFHGLAKLGVVEVKPRGEGSFTLDSRGDWVEQLRQVFVKAEEN